MARIDNWNNYLTDVADAIRTKKGSEELISAEDFDTEIENLPSGADLSEYFVTEITSNTSISTNETFIKKMPDIYIANNVTSLSNMFKSWKFPVVAKVICNDNVTNMSTMYGFVDNAEEIDVSGLNTSNVTNMSNMFISNGGSKLKKIIFGSGFVTTNVTNMSKMFYYRNVPTFTSLDLSGFETPLLENTSNMFMYCSYLQHIDMRKMTFDNVSTYTNMFTNVPDDCEIIVKSQTEKDWITSKFTNFTNVKTVAEYEALQNA